MRSMNCTEDGPMHSVVSLSRCGRVRLGRWAGSCGNRRKCSAAVGAHASGHRAGQFNNLEPFRQLKLGHKSKDQKPMLKLKLVIATHICSALFGFAIWDSLNAAGPYMAPHPDKHEARELTRFVKALQRECRKSDCRFLRNRHHITR